MPVRLLETTIRRLQNLAIIDLTDEIDAWGETALQEAFSTAIAVSPQAALLNFTDVDYINSSAFTPAR